jgi:hypothetical protein
VSEFIVVQTCSVCAWERFPTDTDPNIHVARVERYQIDELLAAGFTQLAAPGRVDGSARGTLTIASAPVAPRRLIDASPSDGSNVRGSVS